MYIWSIRKVVDQISTGSLSEWQKARYLIGTFVLPIITGYTISLLRAGAPDDRTGFLAYGLALVVEIAINVIGFILLFNIHASAHQSGFVEKAICISLPAAVKTFVLGWIGLGSFALLMGFAASEFVLENVMRVLSENGMIISTIYFNLLFFAFMRHGFKLIAHRPSNAA
jgi:hypothetical protein